MELNDIVQNAVAVVAVIISAVALIRTRRFEAAQIRFQETADRLTRLQTEILERDEAERRHREQELEAARVAELGTQAEKERRRQGVVAKGNLNVGWSMAFGEERLNVQNAGEVPARDVRLELQVRGGALPELAQQDLERHFPLAVLMPGDEVFIRAKHLPHEKDQIRTRIEWSTEAGTFYKEGDGNHLAWESRVRHR